MSCIISRLTGNIEFEHNIEKKTASFDTFFFNIEFVRWKQITIRILGGVLKNSTQSVIFGRLHIKKSDAL